MLGITDAISIIQPLQPTCSDWMELEPPPAWVTLGYAGRRFYHAQTKIMVISAVEVAKDADGIDRGAEYHISISKNGGRCTSQEAKTVLEQFEIYGAEEDNHVPGGVVRNFWLPVADRFVGLECACKDAEPAIKEDKGDYVWRGVTT
jgi:hypothetical protein